MVKPFSLTVWIWFIAFLIITMIFYAIFVHYYKKVHPGSFHANWLDSVMDIYGHELSQGKLAIYMLLTTNIKCEYVRHDC